MAMGGDEARAWDSLATRAPATMRAKCQRDKIAVDSALAAGAGPSAP